VSVTADFIGVLADLLHPEPTAGVAPSTGQLQRDVRRE
jgi:hypothetical protein